MHQLLISIALRLLLCAAATYAFWRYLGPIGLVVSLPLYGVMLAKPLLDLVSEIKHGVKALAYAPIEGRHFEHHGHVINIAEDERHHRWVSLQDVRKLIPSLPRPAVLQAQFKDDVQHDPAIAGHRIRAEALLQYLGKATQADSLRFRNWLERDVVVPGARVRQRLGIRDDDPAD